MGSRTPRILPVVARGEREVGGRGLARAEERRRGRRGRMVGSILGGGGGEVRWAGNGRSAGMGVTEMVISWLI